MHLDKSLLKRNLILPQMPSITTLHLNRLDFSDIFTGLDFCRIFSVIFPNTNHLVISCENLAMISSIKQQVNEHFMYLKSHQLRTNDEMHFDNLQYQKRMGIDLNSANDLSM